MSTDYGIGCRTCRDAAVTAPGGFSMSDGERTFFSGEWDNCRYYNCEAIRTLIQARTEIIAVSDAVGHLVRFSWSNFAESAVTGDLATFFKAHAGHVLGPMDEYLQFEGEKFYEIYI